MSNFYELANAFDRTNLVTNRNKIEYIDDDFRSVLQSLSLIADSHKHT